MHYALAIGNRLYTVGIATGTIILSINYAADPQHIKDKTQFR